jgi:ubiquitin-conjugating enzyme E2 variant
MEAPSTRLPGHDRIGGLTRTVEISSLAIAVTLLAANLIHVFTANLLLHWWAPIVSVAAALGADFVSGVVHWTADTWFSETMPILGRRFLRPFRVHHVNPEDFLRRDLIDCNGDVAMLNIPILIAALSMPVASGLGAAASLALIGFCTTSLPTNQVHQWAHMPAPPAPVQWLQRRGLILSQEEHGRHHREPYVTHYCIATGWCNRWLSALNFFATCERLVTRAFGLEPRADEKVFEEGALLCFHYPSLLTVPELRGCTPFRSK